MKKTKFYGKIENGKLEIYDGEGYRKTLSNMQGEIEIVICRKEDQRTINQNNAMHLYFTQLAESLNERGFYISKVIRAEIPWTLTSIKELLWRPVQKLFIGKESTTELNKGEDINKIYDIVNKAVAERTGVHVPFPSIDAAIDREREKEFEK